MMAKNSVFPISITSRPLRIAGVFILVFSLPLIIYLALLYWPSFSKGVYLYPYVAIGDSLDDSVNPCEDFYAFACGNWHKSASKLTVRRFVDSFSLLQEVANKRMKEIFLSSSPQHDFPDIVNYALEFHEACMNVSNAAKTEELDETFRDFLNELGGCPLLHNSTWNERDYDWVKASGVLLRWLNTGFIFNIRTMMNPNDTSKYVLLIQPTSKRVPMENYLPYLNSLAYTLNSELPPHVLFYKLQDMAALEKTLLEFLNQFNKSEPTMTTIGKLQQEVPEIDWLYLFQTFTNETLCDMGCLKENSRIAVQDVDYLKKIMTFLATEDMKKETIANLIFWYGVSEYFPLFPGFLSRFGKDNNVLQKDLLETLENTCYEQTSDIFEASFNYLYIQRYIEDFDRSAIEELVRYIKSSFKSMMVNSTWLDDITRSKMLEKLEAMQIVIGHTNSSLNKTLLDEQYANFPTLSNSSVSNYLLTLKYFVSENLLSLKQINSTSLLTLPRPVTYVGAYNLVEKNVLILSMVLQNPPFFYKNGSKFLNFGGLGFIIGHELSHGFDNIGGLRDKTGSYTNWWTVNVTEEYNKRLSCFSEESANEEDTTEKKNALALSEDSADSVGIKVAYAAYKKWESINGIESRYPGLEKYTSDQMFYIGFASQFCTSRTKRRNEDPHSPKPLRVIGSLSNSASFAEVFNCPIESDMNPVDKCSIW